MASRYESDMTRKEKMQLEKEKLSKMNFKEKLAYIWEYYKAVIFGDVGYSWILALWSDPVHFLDVGGCVVVYWLHNNTVCHQR